MNTKTYGMGKLKAAKLLMVLFAFLLGGCGSLSIGYREFSTNFQYSGGRTAYDITDYQGSSKNVSIPANVKEEGERALPVTSIRSGAFAGKNLTGVRIPSSVTTIEGGAFANNPALSAITVDANNPAYTTIDGVLFSKDGRTLVAYPAGKGSSYAIPQGVT
ncbi:MAG: leucine-rich repeat domain-containing protein, partial [Treponema sp.]|nr:leucine-rich repeat domain-containing protein [Treponema sp.]